MLLYFRKLLSSLVECGKNVEFGLKLKGFNGKERRNIAIEYLKMVHLSKFQHAQVHELSGGMKQREP